LLYSLIARFSEPRKSGDIIELLQSSLAIEEECVFLEVEVDWVFKIASEGESMGSEEFLARLAVRLCCREFVDVATFCHGSMGDAHFRFTTSNALFLVLARSAGDGNDSRSRYTETPDFDSQLGG
jgi:hypothetical protein